MEKTFYCVYAKRVAIELRKRGFIIEKVGVNYKFPKFDVFYFKNTPALQQALKTIHN